MPETKLQLKIIQGKTPVDSVPRFVLLRQFVKRLSSQGQSMDGALSFHILTTRGMVDAHSQSYVPAGSSSGFSEHSQLGRLLVS